jgi:filamentous hemagglutinin family protein
VITGGATRGTNLFHSFQEFSVPTDGFAYFNNARNIQNIMARVTGGSVSNIDGWIAANGTANLFLLNPKGIIFGANAQLDIGGSFLASTANSFTFPNGIAFSATNPQAPPLLTINVPIGLQYGSNPGNMVNQASATDSDGRILGLQVQPGKSIALVGGNVTLSGGGLSAAGGRVEIGGLTTSGIVGLTVDANTLHLNFPLNITRGNVTLSNDARVGVRGVGGGDIVVNTNNFTTTNGGRLVAGTEGSGNGGDIIVNADAVNISGRGATVGSGFLNDALPGSSGNLGDIIINARSINLTGTSALLDQGNLGSETGVLNQARFDSSGNTGNIFINTESFNASLGAGVGSRTGGFGNAGDVVIYAKNINLSELGFIESATLFDRGNVGNVTINTKTLTLQNGATVGAVTLGDGLAGTVTVKASESVEVIGTSVEGSPSFLTANTSGSGNAGNVAINTKKLMVRDGAAVMVGTSGAGAAGNITVDASEFVELSGVSTIRYGNGLLFQSGSHLSALTSGSGDAGNIAITTGKLMVRDGGSISALSDDSSGNAGNLTIRASDVEVSGESAPGMLGSSGSNLYVITSGAGDAGILTIEAERLIVRDGGNISASTFDSSGDAGTVRIRASDVELIGTSTNGLFSSGLSASVGQEATGVGGNITVEAQRLSVRDGAEISTFTLGSGDAGSITIRASDVQLMGTGKSGLIDQSGLSSQTFGAGDGGPINVDTEHLLIRDGAQITASTAKGSDLTDTNAGRGRGGNIQVNALESVELIGTSATQFPTASSISSEVGVGTIGTGGNVDVVTRQLTIRDGAEISVATLGIGNAGSVSVRASDVELIGTSTDGQFLSRLSAEARFSNTAGNGGSVMVDTERLTVRDRAQINVSNQGIGNAGNLNVAANSILLDNQGQLNASSTSGKGGSINLEVNDLLLMRHNSLISAVNGSPNGEGLDGNITINTQFLVAVPSENSDIVANGFGRTPGSNIQITAQGIFGTEFRERLTPKSDIVATGKVTLNTPGVDPSRGLAQLPTNVVNAEELIDRHCTPNQSSDQRSSFTVTGRGGLPPSPNEPLRNEEVITNWITLPSEEESPDAATNNKPTNSNNQPLVEAQGWAINEQGQVVLTATATTVTPQNPWLPSPSCPSSQARTQ